MNSEDLIALGARLKCGEYSGADVMQAWLAIDELIDCKAALSQQEAEPVGEVREWNKNGSGAFKELIGIDKLNDGDKLYLGPPKPAALPQPDASEIPCARCGGECVEFTVPNSIWNAVIRPDGRERDDEYLCIDCWQNALEEHLLKPVASVPQDVEEFANDVAEWSHTQFEDVIRVSHFREFMRRRDAGSVRVPVELATKEGIDSAVVVPSAVKGRVFSEMFWLGVYECQRAIITASKEGV